MRCNCGHRRKFQKSAIPVSTRIVEQLAYGKDLKGGAVPGIAQVPGSIRRRINVHIGGIGASGTADQDGTCAQAGIDSAKDVLK